jgi:hypothetical protein
MAAVTAGVVAAGATAYSANRQAAAARSGSRSTQSEPQWLQDAQRFAVDRSQQIADRTYQPYTRQRIAGQTQNEIDSGNLAAVNSDANVSARRNLGAAEEQVNEIAASDWNEQTMNQYMNPYIKGVLDPAAKEAKRAYSDELAALRGKAVSMGAFGSERSTQLEGNLNRNYQQNVGDIYSKGHAYAFDAAMKGWQADNSRRLAASDAYRSVGGDISRLNTAQITDLMRTGQSQRLLEQAQLDFDYENFTEERDWDITNLQPLLQSIGAARGGNVTTTTSGPKADKVGTILGAAGTLIGYFGGGTQTAAPSSMWSDRQIASDARAQNLGNLETSIGNMRMPTVDYAE